MSAGSWVATCVNIQPPMTSLSSPRICTLWHLDDHKPNKHRSGRGSGIRGEARTCLRRQSRALQAVRADLRTD